MPRDIREAVSAQSLPKPATRNQSLVQMFQEVERSQEDSVFLLAMEIETSDVYSFLQNPFLIAYQEKYETKGRHST